MSTDARTRATAWISEDGKKIVMHGYSPELVEFYRSLPDSRFLRNATRWACRLTPAAAWRVYSRKEFEDGASVDLELIANKFRRAIQQAGNNHAATMQPAIRKTNAWGHQIRGFWFTDALEAALLAMDMGTGKSKVAIDAMQNQGAETILILCPTSVRGVWRREIAQHALLPMNVVVLEKGTVARRTEQAAAAAVAPRDEPLVIVINYESAWRLPFASWAMTIHWDMIVLDESHRIKSPTSKIGKFCGALALRGRRRLALTGTPMPHSPMDVFGQFRFLDPGLFGTSWTRFRQRYAVCANPAIPQQITGYKNQEELQDKFALLTYRVEAADVLDLPEVQHHRRTFSLSKTARTKYDELERELITEIGDGVVTATNALVKLLRLQQAACGFLVADETREVIELDRGKQDLLRDILEDLPVSEPVVVFCRFKHDLEAVRTVAEKLKRRYGELSGRRRDLTEHATMPDGIDVLGVQIQSGGVGIDLTRARYAIYYSMGFSLGDYQQSLARLHRPGQTRLVNYYHLIAESTVDDYVYRALDKRRDVIDSVLSVLKGNDP